GNTTFTNMLSSGTPWQTVTQAIIYSSEYMTKFGITNPPGNGRPGFQCCTGNCFFFCVEVLVFFLFFAQVLVFFCAQVIVFSFFCVSVFFFFFFFLCTCHFCVLFTLRLPFFSAQFFYSFKGFKKVFVR